MNIEKVIKDSLINFDGKVAVYYDDLNGNVLKINEKEKYNSASCIKIFILIELFNQISNEEINRKMELTYLNKHYVNGSGVMRYLSKGIKLPILDIATLMMIISDNVATNMLIDFLGIDKINKTIENIGCRDTKLYSEFKSVEDEVFSETTAYDYYLVWKKLNDYELFDKEITQEIIDIIKNQKYHEMVGDGIDKIYKEVENPIVNYIVTKSGKYQSVRNDGGIVSTKYGNYILTVDAVRRCDWLNRFGENDQPGKVAILLEMDIQNQTYDDPYNDFMFIDSQIIVLDENNYSIQSWGTGYDDGEYHTSPKIPVGTNGKLVIPYIVDDTCNMVTITFNNQYKIVAQITD